MIKNNNQALCMWQHYTEMFYCLPDYIGNIKQLVDTFCMGYFNNMHKFKKNKANELFWGHFIAMVKIV